MSEYDSGVSSDERGSSQAPDMGSTVVSSELGNPQENAAGGDGVQDNNNRNNGMTIRSRDAEIFDKIKTHFPPAKIKKIMQTDEDIGKVSQATPVITGRSLEFFIALLVDKSSKVARDQGSKRISADIMKKTILTDEKFDFLREVILPQEQ